MFALGGIAIEERPVDVSTGRRSQAKESVFGSLQGLVGGNESPG